MQASLARGSRGGEFDNRATASKVAKRRAERALLLGYPNHAAYQLDEQTAGSVAAVNKLLAQLGPPAVANASERGRGDAEAGERRRLGLRARVLGLGLLRREGAQGALRVRRVAAASPTTSSTAC